MPGIARMAPGGLGYHAMNRGRGRAARFHHAGNYAAFERVIGYALGHVPTLRLSYCVMPHHWHLVPWTEKDGR